MQRNLFAYTAPDGSYPEYLSINDRGGEIEVTVRSPASGDDAGATAVMTMPAEEARKLSAALTGELAASRPVSITINGDRHDLAVAEATYEQLADLAGEPHDASMTVRFGDKERAGRIVSAGQSVVLDDGAVINVARTGNA